MEEAIFLTKYASKVTIIHRRDIFKASKIMLERARNNPKINFKLFKTIKEWTTDENDELSGAIIVDTNNKDEEQIFFKGAFIAIGHCPSTNFLPKNIDLDSNGYILLKKHTMTSIDGIFACGDVTDTRYKQAITAAGQGCKAAIDCEKWLENNGL